MSVFPFRLERKVTLLPLGGLGAFTAFGVEVAVGVDVGVTTRVGFGPVFGPAQAATLSARAKMANTNTALVFARLMFCDFRDFMRESVGGELAIFSPEGPIVSIGENEEHSYILRKDSAQTDPWFAWQRPPPPPGERRSY